MDVMWMRRVTDFGDSGVVLPLALLLLGVLWYAESRRAAWVWARAFVACLVVMTLLKIIFLSCGHRLAWGIASPSGHASLTMLLYGAMAAVVWGQARPVLRYLAVVGVLLLIGLVAYSRLVLQTHNALEVLIGLAVGAMALVCFARPYLRMTHPVIRMRRIGVVLGAALVITYGTVLPAEQMLRGYIPFFRIAACSA